MSALSSPNYGSRGDRHRVCDDSLTPVAQSAKVHAFITKGVRETGMSTDEVKAKLELLKIEHRDLDAAITSLADRTAADQLQLARLKKRKLRLRDEISLLEDQLIPDIIA